MSRSIWQTPLGIDEAWEWYQGEFVTRCSPAAPVIHIMSRWNVDDHMARAIEQAKEANDRHLVLDYAALAICKECGSYGIEAVNECGHGLRDELGRLPGEALWPEVWPREFLLKQRIRPARFSEALFRAGRGRTRARSSSASGSATTRSRTTGSIC